MLIITLLLDPTEALHMLARPPALRAAARMQPHATVMRADSDEGATASCHLLTDEQRRLVQDVFGVVDDSTINACDMPSNDAGQTCFLMPEQWLNPEQAREWPSNDKYICVDNPNFAGQYKGMTPEDSY